MRGLNTPIRTITLQAPNTYTLSFDPSLSYRAGQSIQIQWPGDPKKRYYSLCSSPTEKNQMAITIKVDPSHTFAPILTKLKTGDPVQIEWPFGKFGLPDSLPQQLIFIAGGSGVTPFRSMIKYLVDTAASADAWLFHSVKTPGDLLFKSDFSAWSQSRANLHYVPTVTRREGTDWTLGTGRIGEALLKKHLATLDGHFFLAGPPTFVSEMEMLLKETLKIIPENIRREQW